MSHQATGVAYLCARFGRRDELRGYAERLILEFGIQTCSRWLFEDHAMTNTPTTEEEIDYNRRFAIEDLDDVLSADTLIAFTEPKIDEKLLQFDSDYADLYPTLVGAARGGRHVEFGYAANAGKRLIIVGTRENVFHWLPEIEQYDSFDALLKVLI